MKEVKLTKNQIAVFTGLALQRNELQKEFQAVIEAENEQIKLLAKHYNLEPGDYQVVQEQNDVYLRLVQAKMPEDTPLLEK